MKSFWKVLSAAALVAGLAPYKVEKDEETGKTTYQALLWKMTTSTGEASGKHFDIKLGEGTLGEKLREKAVEREEAHLFTDDLAVTYQTPETAQEDAAESGEAQAEAEAAEAEIEAMAAEAEAQEAQMEAVQAEEAEEAASTEPEEAKTDEP